MTLNANAQGVLTGRFTIPANIPAGSKSVQFVGDQGSWGQAVFVGQGQLTVTQLRQIITEYWRVWIDPLAQTFSVPQPTNLTGVDLWFTAKGTSNVLVQIRETDNGFPARTVLSEALLTPAEISTSGPTRCTWPALWLNANQEYALVVACDDAATALAIAELGKFDSAANRWITAQPYQVGVLLSSSNASTWTAHQDRDLTFRLLTSRFTATARTIALGTVAVTAAAEVMVLAAIERPTADTDVRFELTLPDGADTVITVVENQPVTLPAPVTGNITWQAILSGTTTASPRLYPDVQLIWGARPATSTYISRQLPLTKDEGDPTTLSVYYEALTPGSSAVAVDAQNADESWISVPIDNGAPIGDGWEEIKHVLTNFTASATRIRLTLSGSSAQRPRVRKLRVIAT